MQPCQIISGYYPEIKPGTPFLFWPNLREGQSFADSKTMETKKKSSLKSNKKPKKLSKAKDHLKKSPEEKRRQLIEEIVQKTGLGENEIFEAEQKFKDDFPDGRISLEEFIDQSDVSID